MNTRFLPLRSIKTRVTLTTLTIFLLSTWVLTFSAIRLLQADMERLLGEQQYSTASVAASAINDDFSDRLRALEIEASKLDAASMVNPTDLQLKLEDLSVLLQQFNGGIWVSDDQGTAIAEVPSLPTGWG